MLTAFTDAIYSISLHKKDATSLLLDSSMPVPVMHAYHSYVGFFLLALCIGMAVKIFEDK